MNAFLSGLSQREKLLLATAMVLATFVLLYMAVIRPVNAYGLKAKQEYENAQGLYERVTTGAKQVAVLKAGTNSGKKLKSTQPFRVQVSLIARSVGVPINRIQPSDDGALTIWIDGVPAQSVYRWLAALETDYSISPVRVSMQKSGTEGLVRTQVQFDEAM